MAAKKPAKRLAERILHGLEESLAFCRGEKTLKTTVFLANPPATTPRGIVQIREQLRVSQQVFAQMLNVSSRTVQGWERGLRTPTQSSLRLLQIMQQRPEVVAEVVGLSNDDRSIPPLARQKSKLHVSRT